MTYYWFYSLFSCTKKNDSRNYRMCLEYNNNFLMPGQDSCKLTGV